jgi:EmrB/QacA subfamily drug resistance transporter
VSTLSTPMRPGQATGTARFPGHPGATLATIVLSNFMIGLDGTVVNIALPQMRTALGFSPTGLAWVTSAYTLVFGGLLLLGGRVGDTLGRRRMFIAGLVFFGIASLVGGLAPSAAWLVAARAVQGLGAAMAAPNALALVATNFKEGPQRARALALVTGVYAGAFIIGLIVGGVLTDLASWRWVLFINIPLSVLVLILAPLFINDAERHRGRFDVPGALVSGLGLAALVYGFLHAASDGWGTAATIVPFLVAAVLLPAFVYIELRAENPIVPMKLLASSNRTAGYLNLLILAGPLFAVNFFVTQYLQNVLGYSPLKAGMAFMPMAASLMVCAGITSQLLPRIGPKPVIIGGVVLQIAGALWMSRIHADSGYVAGLLGPVILLGAAPGASFTAANDVILAGVSAKDSGSASSLLEVSQWIGGTVGLSVLVTVYGFAGRGAAGDLPAGVSGKGAADYVLSHGMGAAFIGATVFSILALLVTLLLLGHIAPANTRVVAAEEGETPNTPAIPTVTTATESAIAD